MKKKIFQIFFLFSTKNYILKTGNCWNGRKFPKLGNAEIADCRKFTKPELPEFSSNFSRNFSWKTRFSIIFFWKPTIAGTARNFENRQLPELPIIHRMRRNLMIKIEMLKFSEKNMQTHNFRQFFPANCRFVENLGNGKLSPLNSLFDW